MEFITAVQKYAKSLPAELQEKKGIYSLSYVVAERKTFLSKQKLSYEAKFRVDEADKSVKFTEMLREDSAGMQAGMGFQIETYGTAKGGERGGGIEQQSDQFGKKYNFSFNFKAVRDRMEKMAKDAGYEFSYHMTSISF